MSEEHHPVVQLLLSRMASHPEEFVEDHGGPLDFSPRWGRLFDSVCRFASSEEMELLNNSFRAIQLNHLHEEVMDELLNGEDRRAKQREMKERMAQQQAAQAQVQWGQKNSALNTYTVGSGALGGVATSSPQSTIQQSTIQDILEKSGLMNRALDKFKKNSGL